MAVLKFIYWYPKIVVFQFHTKQYTEEALKDLSIKDFQSCISTLKTNDRTNDCTRMSTANAGFDSGDSELEVSYCVKHYKKFTKLFFYLRMGKKE